jgi:hypothetical protein
MLTRAALAWLAILLLSALVFLAAWLLVPWIRPGASRAAWSIGALWLLLTLAFEFLAGHHLIGDSWERLLAEYNVARGRIWILVLVSVLVAPVVVHAIRLRPP